MKPLRILPLLCLVLLSACDFEDNNGTFDPGPLPPGALNQFLWKPRSESNGNLVILLPSAFRGTVRSCTISGGFGSEEGVFKTDSHNGLRPHFTFSRPGGAYGDNVTVQARYDGDRVYSWVVPRGGSRYEEVFTGF